MANGVQLATAYISLNVRTDDIKKQVSSALSSVGGQGRQVGQSIGSKIAEGIKNSLGLSSLSMSIFNPMEVAGVRWALRAGAAIGGALKKAIVGAIGGLGLGAIFGAGGILTAGLDRLKTLQQSTVQLSLKLKPEDIKKLQNDIRSVVEGTPIPLDKAMQAVPRAINAGLRGDAVKQYIKDIADLTASTGGQGQFDQLAVILEQIRSKGKLAGDEVQQLVDAGVDVRGILKDTFGWDDKTLERNLAKGKVGINELQKAIQKSFGSTASGGLAKEMGKTFDGAIGSLKASAARLGANFIAAVLGKQANEDPLADYAMGIGKITDGLNNMGKWVDEHRDDIHNVFKRIGDVTSWVGDKVSKLPGFFRSVGDAAKTAADWFSTTWDKATNAVSRVGDKVKSVVDAIKTKIGTIVEDLKKKFDGIFGENGWFAQQFDKLGKIVDKVREVLGLGPATANAATTPTNTGPAAAGKSGSSLSVGGGRGMSTTGSTGGSLGGNPLSLTLGPGANKPSPLGPQAAGTAQKSGMILGTGQPYGLPMGADTGGYGNPNAAKMFPPWVLQLGDRFDVKPSTYSGHQEGSGMNRGIDWVGTVEQMQAFAEFLTSSKIPGLEQVIWQNPTTMKPLGLTPDGQIVNIPDGYYRDDWAGHRDHVHTRFSQNLDLSQFASGGHVWGSGTATSDSIPAMLSNGEHVLTAADVKKMGGQSGVYAFRNALQAGLLPGFAPGGAVDPNVVQDAQNNVGALNNAYAVAQAQLMELMQAGDAPPSQMLQANQNLSKTKRDLDNAVADLPIITAGGTPPDRSPQNRVMDLTDQLALLQQQLQDQKDAGTDVPYSQQLQQNYQLESLKRDRNQAIADLQGTGTDYGNEFIRSLGLIPAGAGSTGVAGTSSLSGFINMGNSVVAGLIDTGKNLAQQAAGTAVALGTAGAGAGPGAGIAAQIATSYGIELAANTAKRLSSYGFQMAGIGADALVEQLFPFGMPRWLGYDYTGFAPQIGIQQAFTSTIEKMGSDAIKKQFAGQQGMNIPPEPGPVNTTPSGPSAGGSASVQIGAPAQQPAQVGAPGVQADGQYTFGINPLDPLGAGGNGGGGSWAKGGAIGVYDNGGVLRPGQLALNASRTPESILTKQQWNAMMANASTSSRDNAPLVQNLYAQDMQDAIRQLEKVKRRDMMQYAGRP